MYFLNCQFISLSFIFLKFSKTVNLVFALESEIKLSVEPESQSSECDLSTLLRLLLIVALPHKFLSPISFFEFLKLLSILYTSHVLLRYCK